MGDHVLALLHVNAAHHCIETAKCISEGVCDTQLPTARCLVPRGQDADGQDADTAAHSLLERLRVGDIHFPPCAFHEIAGRRSEVLAELLRTFDAAPSARNDNAWTHFLEL